MQPGPGTGPINSTSTFVSLIYETTYCDYTSTHHHALGTLSVPTCRTEKRPGGGGGGRGGEEEGEGMRIGGVEVSSNGTWGNSPCGARHGMSDNIPYMPRPATSSPPFDQSQSSGLVWLQKALSVVLRA